MKDKGPIESPRQQLARRLVTGIIGAAIGFVVLWLVADIVVAVIVGGGLGFVIGVKLTNRTSKHENIRHDVYGSPIGRVGRGGTGDWTP